MKKIVLTATILASFGLTTVSCTKKKTSDPTPSKTPQELLTSGGWMIVSQSGTSLGFPVSAVKDCEKDNVTIFKTDGTETTDEGATKCDSEDPQTSSGTYVLGSDGKTLTITEDGASMPMQVIELTDTKLVLKFSSPPIVDITMEYKKK